MPGINADLALLAQLAKGGIHPAETPGIVEIDPLRGTHSGLADPHMGRRQVIVEGEILQYWIIDVEHADVVILPQTHLVKRRRQSIKTVDGHVHPALLHIVVAHIPGCQHIEDDTRGFRLEAIKQCRNQRRFGVVTDHQAKYPLGIGRIKA